jgi:hypothetical protein
LVLYIPCRFMDQQLCKKKRLLYMLGSAAPRAWIQHGNLWQRRLSRAADLWKLMVAVLGDLEI